MSRGSAVDYHAEEQAGVARLSLQLSSRVHLSKFQIYLLILYNAEEAEVKWFYEELQDLLELTPKKDVLFIIGDWNAKVGSQIWNTE